MSPDLEQFLFKLNSICDDMGVYPQAVKGYNDERDYTQRDGYKNGWNACVISFCNQVYSLLEAEGTPWNSAERLFLADTESEENYGTFSLSEDGKWSVWLNDTWYYACSDAEEIKPEHMNDVAEWFRKYGRAGVLYWVYLQRGSLPQTPYARQKVNAIIALEQK